MEEQNLKKTFLNLIARTGRKQSREVWIGNVPLGGKYPVRIQSMAGSPTMDTEACVEESIRIIRAGADYIRFTAQNVKEAENLAIIKDILRRKGWNTPLIADVHFNPKIAETAARFVEKVRINPGNFARIVPVAEDFPGEKKQELYREQIREQMMPLLRICKKNHTALRLGVNHGSLSKRILEQYGDTPRGMVISAMEYLQICREENFHDIVLSMKSSNARVMVQAYRMLVAAMAGEGALYPLHLGITEAGEGEDGRIKSAVGIGSLLADGLGDTLRVSLTEPSEREIPVAGHLTEFISLRQNRRKKISFPASFSPFSFQPVRSRVTNPLFPDMPVVVGNFSVAGDGDPGPDFIYAEDIKYSPRKDGDIKYIVAGDTWIKEEGKRKGAFPITGSVHDFKQLSDAPLVFVMVPASEEGIRRLLSLPPGNTKIIGVARAGEKDSVLEIRDFFFGLEEHNVRFPVIIRKKYFSDTTEHFWIEAAAELGPVFLDGMANGLWLEYSDDNTGRSAVHTAFGILQASRVRTFHPEYISCPSCGRTLFDIQKVTAEIRKRTSRLKGIKIAVMGCIVNGPGEMADADYGYVGSGKDRITLYKNREIVKKNIPAEEAVDQLIRLIKENGDWREKDKG